MQTSFLFRIGYLFSFALLVLFFTSCGDEEKVNNPALDPTLVSESVNVVNAIEKQGNPPSPTSNAPQATSLNPSLSLKPGQTAYLPILFENAENPVTGFYLQVNGASTYFEGTFPKNKSNRRKSNLKNSKFKRFVGTEKNGDLEGVIVIPIEIPTSLPLGNFCVSYCVVDSAGNISNIVESCITLTETGTSDTEFLGSDIPWEMKKAVYNFEGETETIFVGETYTDIEGCFKYTELVDYFKLTLKTDGTQINEVKGYYKDEDICTDEVLYEEYYEETGEGYWSYLGDSNEFVLYFIYDDDGDIDGEYITFEVVELSANKFTIKIVYDVDDTEEYFLEK